MAINFPDTPTNGQTFTSNNVTYKYDSSKTAWYVLPANTGDITVNGTLTVNGAVTTTNVWTNTGTGQVNKVIELSGYSYIVPPKFPNTTFTTTMYGAPYGGPGPYTLDYFYLALTANANNAFVNINSDRKPTRCVVKHRGNTYGFSTYDGPQSTFYSITFGNTYTRSKTTVNWDDGDAVEITVFYVPSGNNVNVAWFNPSALGISNFKGATVEYYAKVEDVPVDSTGYTANGATIMGTIQYMSPMTDWYSTYPSKTYGAVYYNTPVASRNGIQSSTYETPANVLVQDIIIANYFYTTNTAENRLYYYNSSYPTGNAAIYWKAKVWTIS